MIPTFASPGVMTPGQFGPIIRQPASATARLTRASSRAGMPSVMQTISGILASAASSTASAANGGGTKIMVALAPVRATASATVSNTGIPSTSVPPRPGVTPPTRFVPYSRQAREWRLPASPVMP